MKLNTEIRFVKEPVVLKRIVVILSQSIYIEGKIPKATIFIGNQSCKKLHENSDNLQCLCRKTEDEVKAQLHWDIFPVKEVLYISGSDYLIVLCASDALGMPRG